MTNLSTRRMSRYALLLLLALSACSGASQGPPDDVENACAIKRDRPSWFRAMSATERRWGAPVHVQLATLYQESTFRPRARTPRKYFLGFIPAGRVSSAYGYAQAIDGTWDWYRDETGRRYAKRHRFHDATDFMGWYMSKTTREAGVSPGDAYNQYLAYHEGHSGYRVQSRAERYQIQLAACP